MPVNSYSFKINIPTNNIPIITLCDFTGVVPPEVPSSNAVDTSDFLPSTNQAYLDIPANSMLVVIHTSVNYYQIVIKRNATSSTKNYTPINNNYYYYIGSLGDNSTVAFYGTDGILSNMLLFSASDSVSDDNLYDRTYISTKSLLINLPE